MAFLKKLQTFAIVNALILAICFPPVTKHAEAAVTNADFGFVVWVDEIRGQTGLLDLIGAGIGSIVNNVDITFRNTRVTGLSMSKTVRTEHGEMAVTLKSSRPNVTLNLGTLRLKANQLSFGRITKFPVPIISPEAGLGDVYAVGEIVESSSIQIPDLTVETSFDKNEVARIQNMYKAIEEFNPEEMAEKLILGIDEAEGGKLSQQKEEYEGLLSDLPIQQENIIQIEQVLKKAEQKRSEINNNITNLEDVINQAEELINQSEWDETLENIHKKKESVTTELGDFALTVEQADDLIDAVQKTVVKYVELVDLRSKYLEELGLDDWSKSYQELQEVKETLKAIVNKLEKYIGRINVLTNKKDEFNKRIEHISATIESLEFNGRNKSDDNQENKEKLKSSLKQLNEQLETLKENETPESDDPSDDNNAIDDELTLEELEHEFKQTIMNIEKQIAQFSEKEYAEKEKEILGALKKELALYTKQFIKYSKALNEQKNEIEQKEQLNEEEEKQFKNLEEQIASIESIIARIEEFENELSQLIK